MSKTKYELYIETDEGVKKVTAPLTKPPRCVIGPAAAPKRKGVKTDDDTSQT